MTDSKYFTTNKKGEIFELKAELNNEKKEKRKEAVKKVIAAMTVGKDVRCCCSKTNFCYFCFVC
uniref:Schlafen family member 5 n=1 Tax=Callithrix jacchus TaxID=9483 RepID=A0A2R8MWP5_CALJA